MIHDLFYQRHIMIILNELGEVLDSENFNDHKREGSLAAYPVYLCKRQNSPHQTKKKEKYKEKYSLGARTALGTI